MSPARMAAFLSRGRWIKIWLFPFKEMHYLKIATTLFMSQVQASIGKALWPFANTD